MTSPWRRMACGIATLCVAAPALASFHASDLIYVPAVAHTEGVNGSQWRSDLYITNVDEVAIDVVMVYLPSGLLNNALSFSDRSEWLGGRESEGVGFVNEALADIPPNGTVVLEDVVGAYWQSQAGVAGLGAMVVFAHEAGSLQANGDRVYRNAVVMSRAYNETTVWEPDPANEGQFLEVPATYGQIVPGVPWYNLADPAAVNDLGNFSFQILTGGVETEEYRYNVGLLNASDPMTVISVSVQPFRPSGEPYLDELGSPVASLLTMPPLSHVQYNQILSNSFQIESAEQVMIKVSFVSWSSAAADPIPAVTSYGSVIDQRSNDPTTILPSFAYPYNVDCMWPSDQAKAADSSRVGARPLTVPPL